VRKLIRAITFVIVVGVFQELDLRASVCRARRADFTLTLTLTLRSNRASVHNLRTNFGRIACMSAANTAEPIEMSFRADSRGPRETCFRQRCAFGATCRIRWIDPCKFAAITVVVLVLCGIFPALLALVPSPKVDKR